MASIASITLPEFMNSFIPRHSLPLAGTALILALLVRMLQPLAIKNLRNLQKISPASTSTGNVEEPFVTPVPEPDLDFDPASRLPKLYRPFRHGPNFITMGIRKMDWNNWIEMDSYFLRYHDRKASELGKDFDEHIKYVDNAVTKDACFELYEELVKYLIRRYPKVFQLGANTVHNVLTGENFPFPAQSPSEALSSSALLVQDDLVIMVENDGTASVPCFGTRRRLIR
ncbi:hypothetical protein BDW75DRAFT_245992 [Aspergillus navahoensis]